MGSRGFNQDHGNDLGKVLSLQENSKYRMVCGTSSDVPHCKGNEILEEINYLGLFKTGSSRR